MSLNAQLKLECRQARDTVNALVDFIAERRDIDAGHRALLRYDFERAMVEIPDLDRAVDKTPAVGLLAPLTASSDVLLATLAGVRDGRPLGIFSGGMARLPVVTGLLPAGDRLGLSCCLRFTHEDPVQAAAKAADTVGRMMGATADVPRRSLETGVRISILSLADVIMILARAYFANVKTQGATPSVADVVAVIERTANEDVSSATQTGLSAHHVTAIRSYLEQRFRDHPRLAMLGACGYWDAMAALAPRASAEGRRRLASLLWGGLGDFDTVYGELAGAIELLNHTSDVVCPVDAIRAPMASAGWGEAHPFTILAAGTLLSNAEPAGELVEVRTRFGQPVAVARNILAALVRDVTLTVEGDAGAMLARTDVVQLPTTCLPVTPRETHARPLAVRHMDAAADAPWLARALMQAKTLYLAESETSSFGLTGLLLHLDGAAPLPALLAPIVAQWIEHTQGQTPQAREANDTSLFVAVDALVTTSPLAPLKAFLGPTSRITNWLDRWGTDQAFNNLFILGVAQRSAGPAVTGAASKRLAGERPQQGTALATLETGLGGLQAGQWLKHVRDAAVAVDEALNSGDGGVVYLAQSIAAIDYARAKRRQISARLQDARMLLTDALERFLYASAPDADNDWRHRAALATQARLRAIATDQRLGHLIGALSPRERDFAWTFERMAFEAATAESSGLMQRITALEQIDETSADRLAARFAQRAVEQWYRGMRLTAISPGGPQAFGFTEATFGHVADELAIAASRADIEARISAGVTRALLTSKGAVPLQAARAAMIANEVIASFLAQLGFDSPWSSRHPRRRGTLGAPLFERAAASSAEDLATMQAGRITLQFAADWCEGFGLMTEENVTSARGMRFEEGEFRELAELLSMLGANARERAL
jgi:hypothetical protein